MKRKTKKKAIDERTYSYDSLVNSKRYEPHYWAARVALKRDRRYTLEEADKAVEDYLNERR